MFSVNVDLVRFELSFIMRYSLLSIFLLIAVTNGLPSTKREMGPRAYTTTSQDGYYGEAGASLVNIPQNNGNADLFYTTVKGPTGLTWWQLLQGTPWKAEVGLVNVGAHDDGTKAKASTKFGAAGLEVGSGMMGRASLTEGTFGVGPVDFNMGIGADTGIIWDRGLEAKYLGIGGKIGADGIQGCFILCLGISCC